MKAVGADNLKHADAARKILGENQVVGINLISSPGAGKTTLLERTIKDNPDLKFGVIEGDVFTDRDASRIVSAGAPAVQLNTEGSCHLTAHMIEAVLNKFNLKELDFLIVENIGNLICPSGYDLGENLRVTLLSTPEGSDKVRKYPAAFDSAGLVLITKNDIADVVGFDFAIVADDLAAVNPDVKSIRVSTVSGEGLDKWYECLRKLVDLRDSGEIPKAFKF
ncbi:MAG TPA: hydrogenase accessory protein HypB [Firmicutes bacterium]|nr:hydrogenase accessory protein HypB [Bacillota bacterium]